MKIYIHREEVIRASDEVYPLCGPTYTQRCDTEVYGSVVSQSPPTKRCAEQVQVARCTAPGGATRAIAPSEAPEETNRCTDATGSLGNALVTLPHAIHGVCGPLWDMERIHIA